MLISQTIDDALVEIGVKNPIDESAPQEHEFGLRTLNRIIDAYNTQNLLVTYLQDTTIQAPYTVNECEVTPEELETTPRAWKNSITIGHCQEINIEAPMDIQDIFWRQGETDYYSKEMTHNQWSAITTKGNTAIPRRHYIQKMDNNNIKLYFDYIPQEDLELHLLAKMPYTGKNSTGNKYVPTDDIIWNYGFEKMLMKRLAIELAPSYEIVPSQVLIAAAQEAEMHVKRNNSQPMTLESDVSLSRLVGRRSGRLNNNKRG
jgi:hypothetical protein